MFGHFPFVLFFFPLRIRAFVLCGIGGLIRAVRSLCCKQPNTQPALGLRRHVPLIGKKSDEVSFLTRGRLGNSFRLILTHMGLCVCVCLFLERDPPKL